jgi:hypothetical protein
VSIDGKARRTYRRCSFSLELPFVDTHCRPCLSKVKGFSAAPVRPISAYYSRLTGEPPAEFLCVL